MTETATQETRERRLRMRVARILSEEGLRLDPGLGLQIVKDGEVVVSDPVPSTDNPHTRDRNSIRLPGAYSDDGLVERIVAFAREAIRRKAMHEAYHAARKAMIHAPGWTSLAHPVAIALMARLRVPLDRHPGNKSKDVPNQMKPVTGEYETVRTWDILSINLRATFLGTYVSLETKSGQCWLQIDGEYPETIIDAMVGRPITEVLGIPKLARYGVPDLVRRHALAVDAGVAASVVSCASHGGNHLNIEIAPTTWLPFGPPPDEDTERKLALNFEKH